MIGSGARASACRNLVRFVALLAVVFAHAASTAKAGERTEAGARLLRERGCVACHAAPVDLQSLLRPEPAPSLARAGARLSSAYVRELLRDSSGHAPDLLAQLEPPERAQAVEALVHFLASLAGPFDARAQPALSSELDDGERLYHELGCVACHGPQEELELEELEARTVHSMLSPLGDLARKTNVTELTDFLLDPFAARPAGRMPSLALDADEARAIALYLLRDQALGGASHRAEAPGLVYEYYEAPFEEPAPDFDALEPERTGVVARFEDPLEHREDHFGFRVRGSLAVEHAGEYVFSTRSDDGSRLAIDGALVVENDGFHAMERAEGTATLAAGRHELALTYFERDGGEGLEVRWSGPGFEERPIDAALLSHAALALRPLDVEELALDPALAATGRRRFSELGCAACHALDEAPNAARPARALRELDPAASSGCLSTTSAAGSPSYELAEDEGRALRTALEHLGELAVPLPAAERLRERLAELHCTACHARKGEGGPPRALRPYFLTRGNAELGDEGRIPPELDEPGAKLRPEWLRAVLLEGARARPYMATRMPHFRAEDVNELAELFLEVDAPAESSSGSEFSLAAVEAGRRLAGTKGLGCIQCHELAGHPSLGVPAVDLADVHARLQRDWFARLLRDPVALNMNTRMPEFWANGKSPVADVLDGDPERQIDALWTYLSLGRSMPLPEGLVVEDAFYELVPRERAISCGVFMAGVSPRTLVVGFPENVHFAFDVQSSRLAKVWRGRCFNARGTWEGRAGALESPPVEDVLEMPPGPAVAVIDALEDPWPVDRAPRALGRTLDAEGIPTFRYAASGDAGGRCVIEESVRPLLAAGGSRLVRRFDVSEYLPAMLFVRVATGQEIVRLGSNVWRVDGRLTVRLLEWKNAEPPIAVIDGVAELRIAVPGSGPGHVEVELTW